MSKGLMQNNESAKKGSRKAASIVFLAAFAIIAGSAIAQTNSDGPIQVTANEIDIQPQNNLAFFSGNAEFSQNSYVIRSSKFKVVYQNKNSGPGNKIDKLYSESETVLVSDKEKIRGDRLVFDGPTSVATFYGNVVLTQGQNVVTGDELRINTKTKQSTIKSSGGKVRAVFFPDNAN